MAPKCIHISWHGIILLFLIQPVVAEVKVFDSCDDIKSVNNVLQVKETETIGSLIATVNNAKCLSITTKKSPIRVEKTSGDSWALKLQKSVDLDEIETVSYYGVSTKCCPDTPTDGLTYSFSLIINPVDEFLPAFKDPEASINISESHEVGDTAFSMTDINPVKDDDKDSMISYDIQEGGDGRFSMKSSGEIVLDTILDYEENRKFILNISATSEEKTTYSTLIICVQDFDDLNPIFNTTIYKLHIPEDTRPPRCFITTPPVSAYDGDRGLDQPIAYDLTEETYKQLFSVNETGALCVNKKITKGMYPLNIKAMQKDNRKFRTALAVIKLNVEDVNDNNPVMGKEDYNASISEKAGIDSIVLIVSGSDKDEGENAAFEFRLEGDDSTDFKIETKSNEGFLRVAKVLDREKKQSYSFKIYAQETETSDKLKSNKSAVSIEVLDENDNSPKITPPSIVSIADNATVGTFLIQINASDVDSDEAGDVIYSILASPSSSLFEINPETGIITLNCSGCLLNTKEIVLVVEAKDKGDPPRASSTPLIVEIFKTQFSQPKFTKDLFTVVVQEKTQFGFLLQLQAFDRDTDASNLTYSLGDAAPSDLEDMITVAENGSVFSLSPFDFEMNSTFEFGVVVWDGHTRDDATVKIIVTDVNEYPPKIHMARNVKIFENSTVGTIVTELTITDKDASKNELTVWLEGTDGKFKLNANYSAILTHEPFDRKIKSIYNVKVHVTEHGIHQNTSDRELEVIIADSNSPPVFVDADNKTVSNYTFCVKENASLGFDIGAVHAKDVDDGSSGDIHYEILSSEYFDLDRDSGQLTVKRLLNFEECKQYTFTVKATDHSLDSKSVEATVQINVSDITEAPVWPTHPLHVYVTQSQVCKSDEKKLTSKVIILHAQSDEDIEYTLLNMKDKFSLNETSGWLSYSDNLHPGSYTLDVQACSAPGTSVCSDTSVTVTVKSDSVLAFCQGLYTISVNESKPTNTTVLDFKLNKKDEIITFSFSSGNEDEAFIVNSEGELKINKELDRETTKRYEIIINAIISSTREKAETHVFINIEDAQDSPPGFNAGIYKGEIKESAEVGTTVIQVFATDPDVDPEISYSIPNITDNSNGLFDVDKDGYIYLNATVDYDTMDPKLNKTLTFVINADDGVFTSNATVEISVLDVNDLSPEFNNVPTNVSVQEDINIPHNLIKVEATDGDSSDRISFKQNLTQANGATNPFRIHPLTGQIEVVAQLDRENIFHYTLQITAEDLEKHETTTILNVFVTDANDNYPKFDKTTYAMTILEGPKGNGTSISLQASDGDDGSNAELTFTLTSGNENNRFVLEHNGDKINISSVKPFQWSSNDSVIILEVTVRDNGKPSKNTTCKIEVTVEDINDNIPVFYSTYHNSIVKEDVLNETRLPVFPELEVYDGDSTQFGIGSIVFKIAELDIPFGINHSNGEIFTLFTQSTPHLDRETNSTYNITIVATDNCGQGLSGNTTVVITVEDVDDTAPMFNKIVYEFTVSEDASFRTVVGKVEGHDEDTPNDRVYYTIEHEENTPFVINFRTGELIIVGPLNAEEQDHYTLNISASDGTRQTFVSVHVNVTNVINNCPLKGSDQFNITIPEHQPIPSMVANLTNFGLDTQNVSYVMDDAELTSFFNITMSGQISLVKPLQMSALLIKFHVEGDINITTPCVGHIFFTIQPSNDFEPEFCTSKTECGVKYLEFLLHEDFPAKAILGQIITRDNDTRTDEQISLTLEATHNSIKDLISIDDHGILKLQKRIELQDLKNKDIANDTGHIGFTVNATDGGNPSKSSVVHISVKILTDPSSLPMFTNSTYHMGIQEEHRSGATVGNVSASSKHDFLYSLAPNIGQGLPFQINNKTGEIFTKEKLDRESQSCYQFLVSATGTTVKGYTTFSLVNVNVKDINDNAPVFEHAALTITIKENVVKEKFFIVKAVDRDEGQNSEITYQFVENYSGFYINSTTGMVSIIEKIDRETRPSTMLVIKASDNGNPSLNSTLNVSVEVEDVNDERPTFSRTIFTKSISLKNATDYSETPIIQMCAEDMDIGENGHVFYKLQQKENSIFRILPLSGEIYSIVSTIEVGIYNLTVIATDFGYPTLSSEATVIINVSSFHLPLLFTLTPTEVILFVGMKKGLDIVNIDTTQDAVKLLLQGGESHFEIDNKRIKLSQDLSENKLYELQVVVTYSEGVNLTKELKVEVLPLKFEQSIYIASVEEEQKKDRKIIDLDSDAEKKSIVPIQYSLMAGNDAFEIDPRNGTVFLLKELDREKTSSVSLTVFLQLEQEGTQRNSRASDSVLTATATITVYVTDIDDNQPLFGIPKSTLLIPVPDNAEAGYILTTVRAFDPDSGDAGRICYNFVKGTSSSNGTVKLSPQTGTLTLEDPLRVKGHLTLVVEACGCSNPLLCDNITLEISTSAFFITVPISHSTFEENKNSIKEELEKILNLKLQFINSTVHSNRGNVDTAGTDIFIEANRTNGNSISRDELSRKIKSKQGHIDAIFKKYSTAKKKSSPDFSETTAIALIVLASLMFLASFIAILIVCRLWKRQKLEQKKTQNAMKARQNVNGIDCGSTNISDPDEPLELDFDLDDSSLFEHNALSKQVRDGKTEKNGSCQKVTAAEQETVFIMTDENINSDNEDSRAKRTSTSDSTDSEGYANVANENNIGMGQDTNDEEENDDVLHLVEEVIFQDLRPTQDTEIIIINSGSQIIVENENGHDNPESKESLENDEADPYASINDLVESSPVAEETDKTMNNADPTVNGFDESCQENGLKQNKLKAEIDSFATNDPELFSVNDGSDDTMNNTHPTVNGFDESCQERDLKQDKSKAEIDSFTNNDPEQFSVNDESDDTMNKAGPLVGEVDEPSQLRELERDKSENEDDEKTEDDDQLLLNDVSNEIQQQEPTYSSVKKVHSDLKSDTVAQSFENPSFCIDDEEEVITYL